MFIYFERRERESAQTGEGQREGERIPSRLHAEPVAGLDLMNHEIMT